MMTLETGNTQIDEPYDHSAWKEDRRNDDEEYDHSRAKEDARNRVLVELGPPEDEDECAHCGYPVMRGSGAVVRCEMCGAFCCEDHHRRHEAYAWHDIEASRRGSHTPSDAITDDSNHEHEWVVDDMLPGLRQCLTCPIAEPV